MRPLPRRFVLIGALALVLVLPSIAGGRQSRRTGRLDAYLELLETYRSKPDIAASTMATWTDSEVAQAFDAFAHSPGGPSRKEIASPDVRLAFTAVLLHTDAAMQLARGGGPSPGSAAALSAAIANLQVATSILDVMASRLQMAREFPFTPAMWHLAVVRELTASFHWNIEWSVLGRSEGQVHARIKELAEAAEREHTGGGAQMLLAMASLEESSSHMIAPPAFRDALRGNSLGGTIQWLDTRVRHAEDLFRQALARDGTLVEARLRLGHLLLESGRWKEAGNELRSALAAATQPGDIYLACLFLGRAAEEGGDTGEAVTLYEKALAAWPGAQTARIALASVHEKRGDVEEVRASIEPLLDGGAGSTDPWRTYFDGHSDGVRFSDEGRRALDEMRLRVTGPRIP